MWITIDSFHIDYKIMDAVYALVTWGSETERNCNTLGVFTTKENACDYAVKYMNDICPDDDNEMFRPYLMNNFPIRNCDYYQITKHQLDQPSEVNVGNIVRYNRDRFTLQVFNRGEFRWIDIKYENNIIMIKNPDEDNWIDAKKSNKRIF